MKNNALPKAVVEVIENSTVPITLASLLKPDCPLELANRKFCIMTGYNKEEMIGKNCRFLQPTGGAGPVRAKIRAFLADSSVGHGRFMLPNQRKNGDPFFNLLYLSKLIENDKPHYVIGSQFDITTMVADAPRLYDLALTQDLRKTQELFKDTAWSLLGSFSALAESAVVIAQAKLDHER